MATVIDRSPQNICLHFVGRTRFSLLRKGAVSILQGAAICRVTDPVFRGETMPSWPGQDSTEEEALLNESAS